MRYRQAGDEFLEMGADGGRPLHWGWGLAVLGVSLPRLASSVAALKKKEIIKSKLLFH